MVSHCNYDILTISNARQDVCFIEYPIIIFTDKYKKILDCLLVQVG